MAYDWCQICEPGVLTGELLLIDSIVVGDEDSEIDDEVVDDTFTLTVD